MKTIVGKPLMIKILGNNKSGQHQISKDKRKISEDGEKFFKPNFVEEMSSKE